MTYDHLDAPGTEEELQAAQVARERIVALLPSHAVLKATRLTEKGNTFAFFLFCDPILDEEQVNLLMAGLRQRFGEAFVSKFDFTMRRKFAVYVKKRALQCKPVM